MTRKEIVERHIGMTFDFLRHLVKNPELAGRIPDNAEIDFIDKETRSKSERKTISIE